MVKKIVLSPTSRSQIANFCNTIASAWFIGSIVTPSLFSTDFSLMVALRAILGLTLAGSTLLLAMLYSNKRKNIWSI